MRLEHCDLMYAPLTAKTDITTKSVGVAVFQCCKLIRMMSYEIFAFGLADPFMAHIHILPSQSHGVWLEPTEPAAQVSCLNVAAKGQPITTCPTYKPGITNGLYAKGVITPADFSGPKCFDCITPNLTWKTLMETIDRKLAYVNIHTKENLQGEISGIIRMI